MSKYIDSRCKICRRAGKKLFLKGEKCFTSKCPLVKRNYPPGVHGPAQQQPRLTEYGLRLREKQKAKAIYGLREEQFKKYYLEAVRQKGNTEENLVRLLERRLDNVVYRLGLVSSRAQARQLVNHGHILVNGRKVTIPSYLVRIGDEIQVKSSSQKLLHFQTMIKSLDPKDIPSWLEFDPKTFKGKVISEPQLEKAAQDFDTKLIIEFYSR